MKVNIFSQYTLHKQHFEVIIQYYILWTQLIPQSPKFKRVSLNETPEFPFWGLNIFVDFDLTNSNKMENGNKLKK